MLRSAKEAAQVALEVARRAKIAERIERKEAEERQRERATLELARAEFERLAHAAALSGALHIVVTGHDLDVNPLLRQGFVARRLQRRVTFEEHLRSLMREKEEVLSRLADRLVADYPGISVAGDDTMLHRNPLRSTLETMWRRGEIVLHTELHHVMALLRSTSAVDHVWFEQNRARIDGILQAFQALKAVDSKHREVTWENRILGSELQAGTYVTWESSGDGAGMAIAFCPEKLKWLSVHWQELSSWIQEVIDLDSASGRFESRFSFLESDEGRWLIDSEIAETESAGGHPGVIMSELQSAGYSVFLMNTKTSNGSSETIETHEIDLAMLDELADYELRVTWRP